MQNHTEELFAGSAPAVVTSERVLYTPSGFARTSLGYLQEIGTLKVHRPHTAGRKNLTSFLFFTVTEGCGELTYEGKTYVLKKGDCIFIDCRKEYIQSTGRQLWSLAWIHFYGPNMTAIYDKYLERGGRVVFHPVYISEYLALHQRIFALAKSDDHIRDMKINSELDQLLEKVVITGIPQKTYVSNLCFEKGKGYESEETECSAYQGISGCALSGKNFP